MMRFLLTTAAFAVLAMPAMAADMDVAPAPLRFRFASGAVSISV